MRLGIDKDLSNFIGEIREASAYYRDGAISGELWQKP